MNGIKLLKGVMLLFVIASLSGCSHFTSPARVERLESGDSYWMDYNAYRRGTLVLNRAEQDGTSRIVTCSEPAPDAAMELVNKFEANIKAEDVDLAKGKVELTSKAVDLAKRTQMINFLRESLYRLCELSMNTDLSAAQMKDMYEGVSEAAVELVQLEIKQAQGEIDREKTKQLKVIESFVEKGTSPEQIESFITP
ncbi:hypothetical protein T9A_02222 [Alcanivorax jadensis T9]|uniref:Lipoprotein n=1 Tax=Alcanivorax jadensis T9 TaxID=1177181 RepID=A0ABR4WCI3_9GAMM|nr:hypothetical protein [Alcanivorax jadensis]KGD60745.1 hypothetical protein T9A_02222 [Alcanivorax jadensis T9]